MIHKKISIKYNTLISRIPGLFAYGEKDENGLYKIHKSIDSEYGCYGKIVENIKIPFDIKLDNITINNGTTCTYKTLNDLYFKYIDILDKNNKEFKDFMEYGIGKIKVVGIDFNECDLASEYVYLSNVSYMKDKLVKMKKACNFYTDVNENNNDGYMCCLCNKYKRLGGDKMIEFLQGLDKERVKRSEYFYSLVSEKHLSIECNIMLINKGIDDGIKTPYIFEWNAGERYYIGDIVYYDGKTYNCIMNNSGFWNENTHRIEFYNYNGEPYGFEEQKPYEFNDTNKDGNIKLSDITVKGETDSKLLSLRRNREYLNSYEHIEKPSENTDWLYYYRKNHIINIETNNDIYGNIVHFDENMKNGNNLYAYGDVISDIYYDDDYHIYFEYMLGVHLIADFIEEKKDTDNNKIYLFSNFRYDVNDKRCIKYIDKYSYSKDSELDLLISNKIDNETFEKYINGDYDNIDLYGKYEFDISDNIRIYTKRVGYTDDYYKCRNANFSFIKENSYDYQKTPLYKNNFFSRITFAPKKDIDAYIDRGLTSCIEKHLKLGEVKTIFDMENYANSSFFKMN